MLRDITHAVAPFIWAGIAIVMLYLRHQRKMAEINAPHPQAEVEALTSAHAREVAQLRDRVRVLERIATDDARHDSASALAARIDALKD